MIIKTLHKRQLQSLINLAHNDFKNLNNNNKKLTNILSFGFHIKSHPNLNIKSNFLAFPIKSFSDHYSNNKEDKTSESQIPNDTKINYKSKPKHNNNDKNSGQNYFSRSSNKKPFNSNNKSYDNYANKNSNFKNEKNIYNNNNNNKDKYKNKSSDNEFFYKIDHFHNSASKYSLKTNEEEVLKLTQGKPTFLDESLKSNKVHMDIGGYQYKGDKESKKKGEKLLQPGKRMTLQKKTQQRPLSLAEKQELRNRRIQEEKEKARLMTKEEKKLLQNKETAVDRFDPNYWAIEKKKLSQEISQIKKERRIEAQRIFNPEDLLKFQDSERLSKRLARLGVASRRQAEKLISNGMIKVNGEIVRSNVPVSENTEIQVFSNQEYKTPVDGSIKVWLFYKPSGYVSDAKDERKRPTIYQFLAKKGFTASHFIPVGKLDYSSEGLMILTNNGDMAAALEANNTIERAYKIRFFGRMFSQEKVERMRRGVLVNNRIIKFWVETIRQRHTNSWIHLKSYSNSISDIRNVFERLSLRINRIIRTEYGPFRIGKLKNPGDVVETYIPKVLNTYMHYRYKEKLQKSLRKLDDTKLEVIKEQMLKEQRRKLLMKSNKIKNDYSARLDKNGNEDKRDLKMLK